MKQNKLLEIIADVLNVTKEELNINMHRKEIAQWDSLAHIQIIAELEEQLGAEIPFEAIPDITTISDFEKYLK